MVPQTSEMRLLLACARRRTAQKDDESIQQTLSQGIDWTVFARKAVDHGLAGLVGHTLARVAPDMVPDDILDALRLVIDQTRRKNLLLFDELVRLIDGLKKNGIEAIPFKGPTLAIQAYGDLGFRAFKDLDFLVRDSDMAATLATLSSMGYERSAQLTAAQADLIQHLQGREVVFKQTAATAVALHTRLAAKRMALDIDYGGMWLRARPCDLDGRNLLVLAPEDELFVLAIRGGEKMWSDVKWACDVAVHIDSHPKLDWTAIVQRARAQGCWRMLLLATSLAQRYFAVAIPADLAAAAQADHVIEPIVNRVIARWQTDEPPTLADNETVVIDQRRLHDGVIQKARYAALSLFLPKPLHVALLPLPKSLSFAYVPIKIVHDVLTLPLRRSSRKLFERTRRLRTRFVDSDLVSAILPAMALGSVNVRRLHKARDGAHRALAKDIKDAAAWRNLGDAQVGLKRYEDAVGSFDRALALAPGDSRTWKKRKLTMAAIGKREPRSDLPLDPQNANAWAVRAQHLMDSNLLVEAAEASDRSLAIDPQNVAAARVGILSRLHSCDWTRREDDKRRITEGLKTGSHLISPFFHRNISSSEAESLDLARLVGKGIAPSGEPMWRGERYRHDKIRIAYLSTDFRDHVVADVISGCFESHDKKLFDTTAISLGPDDGSKTRTRIQVAFDRFIDVQSVSDAQVAKTLRELEIDIAIDLNGSSGAKRSGILAHRAVPVQVTYLGYPGTSGLPFIDYIIADRKVIPDRNRVHYSEQVVWLPHTYFPTDDKRPVAKTVPSRAEAGLPETGFVFTCHNAAYKFGPELFDVWMRLLQTVEHSVLWLRSQNPAAMGNLWRAAKLRGVAPERLVFAPRLPRSEDHLARLQLAGLFLDTLPYNAHATACDALWVGLPVLTCAGDTFPSRVATSLLSAIGLPEMATTSLREYEELARTLAQNPERLAAIKAKLLRNRDREPLFDTARFTRNLESAYTIMWERTQRGQPPESFAVEDKAGVVSA